MNSSAPSSTGQGAGTQRDILQLAFNQEATLFAVAGESGGRVYSLDPNLALRSHLDSLDVGSLSILELLHGSNLIALVSGGSKPKFAENTVLIWDDARREFVLEFTFAKAVLAVRMRRDRILVAERSRVHCFSFPSASPQKLFTLDTRDNPRGIMEVTRNPTSDRQLLVTPGHKTGSVQLVDLSRTEAASSAAPINILAHEGDLACVALNPQGTMLATTSDRGTLIRIWDTTTRERLHELRRGMDQALIYSVAFCGASDFIAVSSDKGTVHVFALAKPHLNKQLGLKSAVPAPLRGFCSVPYVESQWAAASFTVAAECACLVAFGPGSSTVYAVCVDGSFHKYSFAADSKSCTRLEYNLFSDLYAEEDF